MHVEEAYFSGRELREAVSWVHEGETGGKRKLASILSNPAGDDFQRCIYFCLAGRDVVEMIDDLMWLEELLEARGRVAGHPPPEDQGTSAGLALCCRRTGWPGRRLNRELQARPFLVG